jgi:hypothetical protein
MVSMYSLHLGLHLFPFVFSCVKNYFGCIVCMDAAVSYTLIFCIILFLIFSNKSKLHPEVDFKLFLSPEMNLPSGILAFL